DANGIVNVSAKDKATGKEQQIRIQASGGLSDDDVERMVQEAEQNAEEDKKRRAAVDAHNAADSLIHSSEKNLAEYGDKVPDEDKKAIEDAIADLKGVLEAETPDPEEINAKTEVLTQTSMKLGEAIYKASQEEAAAAEAGGGQSDAEGSNAKDDDPSVVDADFEEVDPDADDSTEDAAFEEADSDDADDAKPKKGKK
ncbi:MAG: Hsp70 family protein, partial [Rhodospirillales bacterium]|nr:Hsp70 family protein [Rhodospirillales bacterium]